MKEERLRELIAEATVDCYGEEEEFWGMLTALGDELNFPLKATLIGESVTLIGLDDNASSPRRGIIASVTRNGKAYSVSLADLQITAPDKHSKEWLAAYQYWFRF
jgi:hypothetical protein